MGVEPTLHKFKTAEDAGASEHGIMPDLPPEVLKGATAAEWATAYAEPTYVDEYTRHALTVSPMTPRLFHESAAHWLLAVAIARRLVVRTAHGPIYPNLFVCWTATTTLWGKSTALKVARDLAERAFPHLLAPHETTPEAMLSDMAGREPTNLAEMADWERECWERERPFAAQRGLLLDELSGLLAGSARDYQAGALEAFLRFYDCDSRFQRSTRGQGRLTVRNAHLSLLGASTPAALSPHLSSELLWANGWWPRFALLTPERERPLWAVATAEGEPSVLLSTLARVSDALPTPVWPDPPEARTVGLEPEALDDLQRYTKAVRYDLLTPAVDGRLYGTYGRLGTQALKLAMTLAAARDLGCRDVPVIRRSDMARAIHTAEQWRASAHRTLATASMTAAEQLMDRIRAILSENRKAPQTANELHKRVPGAKRGEIVDALRELEERGDIAQRRRATTTAGGRPTQEFLLLTAEVNP